jgi:hypothetical protein
LVSVKVLSCLGSQPICSTRLPSLLNATLRFELVVLLPMPPLPYTAKDLGGADLHVRVELHLHAALAVGRPGAGAGAGAPEFAQGHGDDVVHAAAFS